ASHDPKKGRVTGPRAADLWTTNPKSARRQRIARCGRPVADPLVYLQPSGEPERDSAAPAHRQSSSKSWPEALKACKHYEQ
ncbi:MAG: hypothetical protein WBO15_14020, partial [Gammaproteobacteria bacterium]